MSDASKGEVRALPIAGAGEGDLTRGIARYRGGRPITADTRTAVAIALMAFGYTQADAARALGITVGTVREGRRRRGMGALPAGRRTSVVSMPVVVPAVRQPIPAPTRQPAPEVGDPDVCTEEGCSTMEIHRRGDGCRVRGPRNVGSGRPISTAAFSRQTAAIHALNQRVSDGGLGQ